ncbi:hypothetical protein NL676_032095 [Syzygium grande]|nr:hypothetical protein NL676_032095 [Syzygium grande]
MFITTVTVIVAVAVRSGGQRPILRRRRDAPPVQLSSSYPESPTNAMEDASSFTEQPQLMSSAFGEAAK